MCLQFIWNLHRSLYSDELVLTNDYDNAMEISNTVKTHITNMAIQIPFGSTQAISDGIEHYVISNLGAFKYYDTTDLISILLTRYIDLRQKNLLSPNVNNNIVFILEKDLPLIAYSCLPEIYKEKWMIYANCPENRESLDYIILFNFLKGIFPFADDGIYDIDDLKLNKLYLI